MNDEKWYIGMVGLSSGLVMGGRQSWRQQQLPCRQAHTVEAAKFGQAKCYSPLEQGHVTAWCMISCYGKPQTVMPSIFGLMVTPQSVVSHSNWLYIMQSNDHDQKWITAVKLMLVRGNTVVLCEHIFITTSDVTPVQDWRSVMLGVTSSFIGATLSVVGTTAAPVFIPDKGKEDWLGTTSADDGDWQITAFLQ